MKITTFITYLLLLLSFRTIAQPEKNNIVSIKWSNDIKEDLFGGGQNLHPYFNDAYTISEFGLMPCYFLSIPINKTQSITATILPLETDSITYKNRYPDDDVLTDNWQIRVKYRGNNAFVYVLPVKKEKNKLIRLKKFKLQTKFIENGRAVKSYFIPTFADESVLNSGTWYKIGTTKNGVYKLTFTDLEKMGLNPENINPKNIRIYGQYNGMLPEANADPRPDDLVENAITVVGEEDGQFNKEDYILFYGQSALTWTYTPMTGKYTHQNNLYSDTVYYFLNTDIGTGKRIPAAANPGENITDTINTFADCQVVDNDKINLLMSGKLWVGEVFNKDTTVRTFNFNFPDRDISKPVSVKMQILAKGIKNSYFSLFANNNVIIDSAFVLGVSPDSRYYAKKNTKSKLFFDENENINIKLEFAGEDSYNTGWLNYLEINTFRHLRWDGKQIIISNPDGMQEDETDLYQLSNTPDNLIVWNITDKTSVEKIITEKKGNNITFKSSGKKDIKFVAFTAEKTFSPVSYKKIKNQNLHGTGMVNMVIVVPPFLKSYAETIAELHQNKDNLTSIIVTPEEIYNEFSSGVQDVVAIRDFMRMLYLKGLFGTKPPYLLLFGDGSFDYKDRIPGNTNLIPVYESDESLQKTATYGTDDFYGLLDDDEGQNMIGDLDAGIGRFPVSTENESQIVLNKIINYTIPSKANMQEWRNTICFIADDQDLNLHLSQAEGLTEIVDTSYPEININKIYIDAFVREKISSGYRYPEVNSAINKQVKEGALIMNYTGHGGLDGWADEKILTLPQIRSFENIHKLPLFITATCEFSRFDDPEFFSAGEQLFLNEHGGAIALLTTTRLAFAHANVVLNRRIYLNLKNTEGNELPRLGDLIRMAKTPAHTNFLNFSLLGDPALQLAYPKFNIETESILVNGITTDTVTALSKITVKGKITDGNNIIENFNGYLYPKIYDKKSTYITRANSPKSIKQPFDFYDKILFKGNITVKNGTFEFSFLVPQYINPAFGKGKISYYAVDTSNMIDATGYDNNIVVGGINNNAENDNEGPDIKLYINDPDFQENDIVNNNSHLHIRLFDINGINYTGLCIGHDITLTIDDDYANTINLNNSFVIDKDSYQSGKISFPLKKLHAGMHKITVKAWDLNNNSNEASISFIIDNSQPIKFKKIKQYPNPFTDYFYIGFESTLAKPFKATVNIYNITGKKIGSLHKEDFLPTLPYNIYFKWNEHVNTNKPGIYFYELVFEEKETHRKQKFSGKIIKIEQ